MKQIANWVFGSFFRTIGRLLVFVLLGIIISNIIDFGSIIDSFSITDLFFTPIKASGISTTYYVSNAYNSAGSTLASSNIMGDGQMIGFSDSQTQIYYNNQHLVGGNGIPLPANQQNAYAVFTIGLQTSSSVSQSQQSITILSRFSRNTGTIYSTSSCDISFYNYEFGKPENQVGNVIYANVYCPVPVSSDTLYITRLDIQNNNTTDVFQTFHINRNITILLNENYILQQEQQGTTNAINNQTQQQEQQHQEVMDSNTTEAEGEATSFFEDFDAPDIGGLGAIITAPLNTIRALLNSTCTNLVLPLPYVNEDLTLPCMTSIYTEHFGAFFTIYQTIILAIIAYRCIRSIYFDLHGFTNPDDDRIEVMDL